MATRAILFDLDGTLIDSLADIGDAMNFVLQEMGFSPHPLNDYRAFVGDGVTMLARRALPEHRRDDGTVADCVARMRRRYGERSCVQTRPYDGIPELLDATHALGLALAVLSNKPHDLTVELVRTLFDRWPFDPVFGERPGTPRKPDPASALEIAARLGVDPADILYVGDTPTDLATARAAGMPAVAAAWGFRSEQELRSAGATRIARRPDEVLQHLERQDAPRRDKGAAS